ncbi:MAG: helix-turn-helix domain-containing protein [Acidimicrobiales bacterium]
MRNNPTPKSPKPLLSVEEAAVLLGETRSTLYRAIKAGTFPLPTFRIAQRIRIPRRSVERLLAGLPLTPPEDASVVLSHPSTWSRDQLDPAGGPDPVATEDSIFPT